MQGRLTPDPALVERFRHDLAGLWSGEGPLLLAVSGGPDSMAMLALADAAFPERVLAATVDHRLRAGSVEEARLVAAECGRRGIPHATLRPASPIAGASVQARARTARYDLLAGEALRLGATAIATAHHVDDQAETLLMRANRGAGLAGLAGVRPRTDWRVGDRRVALIRPLLDWRRGELRGVVEAAGLPFVADPANEDARFDRSRVRRAIAAVDDCRPDRLARAAANLRDADDALEWLVGEELAIRLRDTVRGELSLDPGDLPRELRRRFLLRAIDAVRLRAGLPADWKKTGVDRLLRTLDAGGQGTLAGVAARARPDGWRLAPAPPRRTG